MPSLVCVLPITASWLAQHSWPPQQSVRVLDTYKTWPFSCPRRLASLPSALYTVHLSKDTTKLRSSTNTLLPWITVRDQQNCQYRRVCLDLPPFSAWPRHCSVPDPHPKLPLRDYARQQSFSLHALTLAHAYCVLSTVKRNFLSLRRKA